MNKTSRPLAVLAGIFLIAQAQTAQAYVDPGSASIIVTAILGAFAAVGYTARMYMAKVKGFFKKDKKAGDIR
jgi:formate hydrogenlyase subunit 3/multisubunit Na+/H+ antiporter MnhD subunit